MMTKQKYHIGLDIGTDSIGFAAIDDHFKLVRSKGKQVIGVRLFKEGETAAERRVFRTMRRRLKRRKWRLGFLDNIFAPHLAKVDPNFLRRIKQSNIANEDPHKEKEFIGAYLFPEQAKEGKEYGYPTMIKLRHEFAEQHPELNDDQLRDELYRIPAFNIYGLRYTMMNEQRKFDLREVYLAIHHIIKYRGNFLNNTPIELFQADKVDFKKTFEDLNNIFLELDGLAPFQINLENAEKIGTILLDSKRTHNDRQRASARLLLVVNGATKKRDKKIATQLLKLILGMKSNTAVIFNVEAGDDTYKINLSDENSDDQLVKLASLLTPDQNELLDQLVKLYSAIMLNEIVPNGQGLSESMMGRYVQHHQQLLELKRFAKTVDRSTAIKISHLYDQYVGKVQGDKNFNFQKDIKRLLDDSELGKTIAAEIEQGNYMPKKRTGENGVIPRQVHQLELEKIIENQSKYYPWLAEENPNKDQNSDAKYKIEQLLTFRVPYYVGPMIDPDVQVKTSGAAFAWAKLKENRPNEAITPWNFNQQIDIDQSATRFVKRMTTKDTYLLTEDVLPAASMIYQRFNVLNELNNVRVNSQHLTTSQKQAIYRELFQNGHYTTVGVKSLQNWFSVHENTISTAHVTGLADEKKFNSNLGTYRDLVGILGKDVVDNPKRLSDLEQIIEWSTVYEDNKITRRKLSQINWLTDQQRDQLSTIRYRGWGRLSKKLLTGIRVNGKNILDRMWASQQNFAQVVHSPEFEKKIDEYNQHELATVNNDDDIIEKVLADAYTSPQNKKAIRQVMLVVKDIERAMGDKPASISLEFARSEENTGRTHSRQSQLEKAFQTTAKEMVANTDLPSQLKDIRDLTDRYYLYFTQAGIDVYTGQPIDIDKISTNYDIDHIYPQSFIKDDSLDNKVLVARPVNSSVKSDQVPYELFGAKMKEYWRQLLDAGLITKRKYQHLTTNPHSLNKYVKQGFIHRQLVETRQVIKLAANILSELYGEDTKIIETRAQNTKQLRDIYHLYKEREVNDYHHAVDAYLTAFGSQYLYQRYPSLRRLFVYGQYLKPHANNNDWHPKSFNLFRHLDQNDKFYQQYVVDKETGELIVDSQSQAEYVRKIQHYKIMLVSKETYQNSGALFGATIYPSKDADKRTLIPLKKGKAVKLYGGYSKERAVFMTIVRINGRKPQYKLVSVPIIALHKLNLAMRDGKQSYLECLKSTIAPQLTVMTKDRKTGKRKPVIKNFDIVVSRVLFNQLIVDDTDAFTLGSATVQHNAKQLILSDRSLKYLEDNFKRVKQMNDFQKQDQVLLDIFDDIVSQMNKYYSLFDQRSNREKLTNGRPLFEQLPPFDKWQGNKVVQRGKASIIMDVLQGLHANAARTKIPELKIPTFGFFNSSNGIRLSSTAVLCFQSPTGLFERKLPLAKYLKKNN